MKKHFVARPSNYISAASKPKKNDVDRRIARLKKLGFYETESGRWDYDINKEYGAAYYDDDEFGGFIYDRDTDKDIKRNLSLDDLLKAIREYR